MQTEIIDLKNDENSCQTFQDYPIQVEGAVGALLSEIPLVCGGVYPATDACWAVQKDGTISKFGHLNTKRGHAAGIVLDDLFWITGGNKGSGPLNTTEFLRIDEGKMIKVKGPELPIPLNYHCMASIDESKVMIIGGFNGEYLSSTFIYNFEEDTWTSGPDLMVPRENHACSTYLNSNGHKKIMVTGGFNGTSLTSTEVLDLEYPHGTWQFGPELPVVLHGHSMVSLENTVYVLGGYSYGSGYQSKIYKLVNNQWEELPQSLKQARKSLVAILVPDGFC